METIIGLALLVLLIMLVMVLLVVLMLFYKIKRVLTRALTFVFTISLKPRWKKL